MLVYFANVLMPMRDISVRQCVTHNIIKRVIFTLNISSYVQILLKIEKDIQRRKKAEELTHYAFCYQLVCTFEAVKEKFG